MVLLLKGVMVGGVPESRMWGASVFQPVSQRRGAFGKREVLVGLSPH